MKFEINFTERTEFKIVNGIEKIRLGLSCDKICLVTDEFCVRRFADKIGCIRSSAGKGDFFVYSIRGEEGKSLEEYGKFVGFLFKKKFSRNSAIISFGGGSISDFSGFAAATYMRGIKLISIPSTFLAQIDASLGGKNALNLGGFKNIIGLFKNPELVVCDLSLVNGEDISRAAGEIIKYIFLLRKSFPLRVRRYYLSLKKGNKKVLKRALEKFAKIKMRLVAEDPRDIMGLREKLNLGHTAAHAFEYALKNRISHSDAVLWGLRYAYVLSRMLLGLSEDFKRDAETMLRLEKSGTSLKGCSCERFLRGVSADKKNRGLDNRFLLFKGKGDIVRVENVSRQALKLALNGVKNEYIGY